MKYYSIYIFTFLINSISVSSIENECVASRNYEDIKKQSESNNPIDGIPCTIPFNFKGNITKQGCITDGDPNGRYWCPTKTDQNRNYIRGFWGYCSLGCKM